MGEPTENNATAQARGRGRSRRQQMRADESAGVDLRTTPTTAAVPTTVPDLAAQGQETLAQKSERATTLYCQGMRPAAIAAVIGVSDATVRRWLRHALKQLTTDAQDARVEALARAIESQRAIAQAAWAAYEQERALEAALLGGTLDRVRRRRLRVEGQPTTASHRVATQSEAVHSHDPTTEAAAPDTLDAAHSTIVRDATPSEHRQTLLEEYERPRHASQGARYLAVALAAQREVARLQGLYEQLGRPPAPVQITLSRRPDGPENLPMLPASAPERSNDDDAQHRR